MRYVRRLALAALVAVYAAALCAAWLAPRDYAEQYRDSPSVAPSAAFPLGTDALGRDMLSRILHGSRVSLSLAPAAALMAALLAALIGGAAGYLGGWPESLAMRAADLMLSLPWLFLLLTFRAVLPLDLEPIHSALVTAVLLGALGWAGPARVVCSAVKGIRRSPALVQARAAGCRPWRLLVIQLLPQVRPVLLAQFWVSIPVFVLAEADLGVLGFGVGEPLPSWGNLLRDLQDVAGVAAHPWLAAPLAVFVAVMICFHLAAPGEDTVR